LPAAALSLRVPDLYDRIAQPIASDNEALPLLLAYAQTLQTGVPLGSPELRGLVARHIYDLVAMMLAPSRATQALSLGGLRAARLHAIKSSIIANLHRHDLTVNMVAEQNRLGPRQVQRLFESEGLTFSEFVQLRRLDKVHAALVDPKMFRRSISALAYGCGFSDISHFNRVFRRRFGASPSEVRCRL
jgi:AraC-like DNA-binding protein